MFFIKVPGKDISTIVMMPGIKKIQKRKISASSGNGFTTIDNSQKKISNNGGKTSRHSGTFTKSSKSTYKHEEMDDKESVDYFNPRYW